VLHPSLYATELLKLQSFEGNFIQWYQVIDKVTCDDCIVFVHYYVANLLNEIVEKLQKKEHSSKNE